MARRKAKVGAAQKLTGYGILALLGLIAVWLLIQQSRFNPAVIVAMRAPELTGRPQAAMETGTARIQIEPERVARHTREFIYDERLSIL